MNQNQRLSPQASEKAFYEEKLLRIFLKGESTVIEWLPHAGRKRTLTYLVENADQFNYSKLGKYQIFYFDLDSLPEESEEGYFQFMLNTMGLMPSQTQKAFFTVKETIGQWLKDGYHLIFILGRFDDLNFSETFFNNLKALWDLDCTKIHFLFAVNRNLNLEKYGKLKTVLSQNCLYFSLLAKKDELFVLKRLANLYHYKVNRDQEKEILALAGGHPTFIRILLKIFSEEKAFHLSEELKIIIADLWESFSGEEKKYLSKLAKQERVETCQERLLALKVIRDNKIFSPLFEDFIKEKALEKIPEVAFDKENGRLLIDREPVKEKLSLREYQLLANFWQKQNQVITREEIAEILWGKDAYEKYSDWSIDKIIYQLRKKIKEIGLQENQLEAVKGRGYRWNE
ncbi:MAG: winged helix-turn-helix domain-containing protein [Patescibacteria group bacterium]|nr:winged helix-turn-helix domain-containing protein [Patescibacteria group bacterium]